VDDKLHFLAALNRGHKAVNGSASIQAAEEIVSAVKPYWAEALRQRSLHGRWWGYIGTIPCSTLFFVNGLVGQGRAASRYALRIQQAP